MNGMYFFKPSLQILETCCCQMVLRCVFRPPRQHFCAFDIRRTHDLHTENQFNLKRLCHRSGNFTLAGQPRKLPLPVIYTMLLDGRRTVRRRRVESVAVRVSWRGWRRAIGMDWIVGLAFQLANMCESTYLIDRRLRHGQSSTGFDEAQYLSLRRGCGTGGGGGALFDWAPTILAISRPCTYFAKVMGDLGISAAPCKSI